MFTLQWPARIDGKARETLPLSLPKLPLLAQQREEAEAIAREILSKHEGEILVVHTVEV